MIKEPYNQYEPYTDVVYSLAGYDIDYPETETYPRFSIHPTEESIHHTLEDAEAKIAVSAITDTILANRRLKLRILCSPDGYWRCLLYSDQESVGYSFFTTAETIVEDIMRILNQ